MYGVKRLGEWLLDKGKITPQQLEDALAYQRETGKRLGESLIALGYITEDDYYEAQAEQWECPYEPLRDAQIQEAMKVRHWIGLQDATRFMVVPLREEGIVLWVASADPNNVEMLDHLRQSTGKFIKVSFSPQTVFSKLSRASTACTTRMCLNRARPWMLRSRRRRTSPTSPTSTRPSTKRP
jgi:hypothetical protein